MPGCPCTKDSACAARVPLPLRRPARRLPGGRPGLRFAFVTVALLAAFTRVVFEPRGRPGPRRRGGALAEADLFPSGSRRNHAAYRDRVDWGGIEEIEQMMLCDAQTSGGLLVAMPPQNAQKFEHGLESARRIGVMRSDGAIRVR